MLFSINVLTCNLSLIDTDDTIHDTTTNTIDTYLNNNNDPSTKDNSSSKGTVSSTCGSSCNTSYTIDGSGDDDDDGGGKMPASTSDEPTNVRTPPQLRSVQDDLERCDRLFAMVDHRNEYFFDCHGTIVPPVYAALHVGQVESALACEVFHFL